MYILAGTQNPLLRGLTRRANIVVMYVLLCSVCFCVMADLSILVTNFFPNFDRKKLVFKVFAFYLFFRLLDPKHQNNTLKDWANRIGGWEMNKLAPAA